MLFKTFSAAVFGIDAYLVEVEVDVEEVEVLVVLSAVSLSVVVVASWPMVRDSVASDPAKLASPA